MVRASRTLPKDEAYKAFLERHDIRNRFISLSTRASSTNIEMTFEDNGGGIEPDIIDRIFEPFFTTREPGKGTDLGLCTLQNTIERHFGSVDKRLKKRLLSATKQIASKIGDSIPAAFKSKHFMRKAK